MENPRDLFLFRVNKNKGRNIIDNYENFKTDINSGVIDLIFYTICDYIKCGREKTEDNKINNLKMSKLEIAFYYTDDFHYNECDLKEYFKNTYIDDSELIIHVYDNYNKIHLPKHRRIIYYLMNILYFDL